MIITITLPEADEVLVKPGQKVDFETPILKRHSKKDIKVPLAQLLKIKSKDIFSHLKKFVGEEVTKNDLIAEVKGMLSTKRYFSEYEGVLKEINHGDGSITIAVKSDQDDIVIKQLTCLNLLTVSGNFFKNSCHFIFMAFAFHSAVQPFSLLRFLLRLQDWNIICFFVNHDIFYDSVTHK